MQAADKIWITASAKRELAKATASRAMRHWEDAQALAEMTAAKGALATTQRTLAATQQELKSAQAAQATVAGELPKVQTVMAVAQKINAAAEAARVSQQKLVDAKSVEAKSAAAAVAQSLESAKLTDNRRQGRCHYRLVKRRQKQSRHQAGKDNDNLTVTERNWRYLLCHSSL